VRFDILTLFPDMVGVPLAQSILGRAQAAGRFELGIHDIRAWGLGRRQVVDDTPYGGGSGMVMRVDVVASAIRSVRREGSRVILFEPSAPRFDQAAARRLAGMEHLVLVCGHYEGIDGRLREHEVDEVLSIGDYVLTGGEYAAMVVVDAVSRLLPGVLGNEASAEDESFAGDTLEYPHYTRPVVWEGHEVPAILRSGDHARVAAWRREQGRERTRTYRPDLAERWPPEPEPKRPRRQTRGGRRPPPDDGGDLPPGS
jgi:tRNA (guanine37-N1)-methyltransferase